jgi:hypothetical protein
MYIVLDSFVKRDHYLIYVRLVRRSLFATSIHDWISGFESAKPASNNGNMFNFESVTIDKQRLRKPQGNRYLVSITNNNRALHSSVNDLDNALNKHLNTPIPIFNRHNRVINSSNKWICDAMYTTYSTPT